LTSFSFLNYILWSCSFEKWTLLFSSVFFSIKLSLSHNLDMRFVRVVQIFLGHFFLSFYIVFQNSILYRIELCFFFLFDFYWITPFTWFYLRVLTISPCFTDVLFFKICFIILSLFLRIDNRFFLFFYNVELGIVF
jgi:hypothetical protein